MTDIITTCQILNSYFLHELAGPLTALSTTTELFNSTNKKIKNNAFNLIINGAADLCNRVKFYSYAYSISQNGQAIPIVQIQKTCNNLLEKTKVKLNYIVNLQITELAPELAKVLMCLIVTAYNNLLRGGKVEIIIENDIIIRAHGKMIQIQPEKIKILNGEISNLEPNVYNGNEYYCRLLIDKKGYNLSIEQFSDIIEYKITY